MESNVTTILTISYRVVRNVTKLRLRLWHIPKTILRENIIRCHNVQEMNFFVALEPAK